MDEPGWTWPAWKFGMKRSDLFTKLHDQYNTVSSSIQDPEAFHHDVYEISHEASSAAEFHSLMGIRKEQRLRELNDSLESASVEIIANPSLIGTTQWQYALQLFRTRSLDSLVRYFSSYLPSGHPWRDAGDSRIGGDPENPITDSHQSFFEDEPVLTHEPLSLSAAASAQLPPSPRSMTMCSDSSAASIDHTHHSYMLDHLTPARTLSFSESEPGHFGLEHACPTLHDDDASQSSDADTPVSSVSDLSETHQKDFLAIKVREEGVEVVSHDGFSSHLVADAMASDAPTPKPHGPASCFFEAKPSPMPSSLRHRSISPSRAYPLVHAAPSDCRKSRTQRVRRRDVSPAGRGRRRGPAEPASRVQKPLSARPRPSARRRRGC